MSIVAGQTASAADVAAALSAVTSNANAAVTAATKIGVGNFSSTDNFGGTISSSHFTAVLGSSGTPDATQDPIVVFQRWSGYTSQGINAPLYSSNFKSVSGSNVSATGAYFEAQDQVGWNGVGNNDFIEGVRAQATLNAGTHLGSAYGAIAVAGESPGSTTHTYIVANESEVDVNSSDASTNFSSSSFVTSFLATSRGANKPDVAYCVNPFMAATSAYLVGFYVPAGTTNSPVVNSAFKSDAASVWGLDLTKAAVTFGAIGIANNTAIRALSTSSTALSLLQLDSSNHCLVAADSSIAAVSIGSASVVTIVAGPLTAPQISLSAESAPGTPGAGKFTIYVDSADNKLKAKGPSGTVTIIALP